GLGFGLAAQVMDHGAHRRTGEFAGAVGRIGISRDRLGVLAFGLLLGLEVRDGAHRVATAAHGEPVWSRAVDAENVVVALLQNLRQALAVIADDSGAGAQRDRQRRGRSLDLIFF